MHTQDTMMVVARRRLASQIDDSVGHGMGSRGSLVVRIANGLIVAKSSFVVGGSSRTFPGADGGIVAGLSSCCIACCVYTTYCRLGDILRGCRRSSSSCRSSRGRAKRSSRCVRALLLVLVALGCGGGQDQERQEEKKERTLAGTTSHF